MEPNSASAASAETEARAVTAWKRIMWRISAYWFAVTRQVLMTAAQQRILPCRAPKGTEKITEEQAKCPHPPGSRKNHGNASASWVRCELCKLRLSYTDKTKKDNLTTKIQQIESATKPITPSEKRAAGPKKKPDGGQRATELKRSAPMDENSMDIEEWKVLEQEALKAVRSQNANGAGRRSAASQGGETLEILREMKRIQEDQTKAMMMLASAMQNLSSAAAASTASSSSAPAAQPMATAAQPMAPTTSEGSWEHSVPDGFEELM